MKRKSVMILLSMLMLSGTLTACQMPDKIGPINLGKSDADTTTPENETTATEYFYGDVPVGTVIGLTECANIMMAQGIDPTQCLSYLYLDLEGFNANEITFDTAGTFSCQVLYQLSDGTVNPIPFTINVVGDTAEAPAPEQTVTQESKVSYDIQYPQLDVVSISEETPSMIAAGKMAQIGGNNYLEGSIKEVESENNMYVDCDDVNYQQALRIYTGVALASQNSGILFPEGQEFILYAYADTTTLKDSPVDISYFAYVPEVDETLLDIESEIKTYKDTGIEYDAGIANAILTQYGPELSAKLEETIITANIAGATQESAPVVEDEPIDIMEEIESLPTDVIEDAPESTPEVTVDAEEELSYEVVKPGHRERYPDVYAWPSDDITYSRWNLKITGNTNVNGVIILPDGTRVPDGDASKDYTDTVNGNSISGSQTSESNNSTNTTTNNQAQQMSEYVLDASYTQFKLQEYKAQNLTFDATSTNKEVVYKSGSDTYHAAVVPLNTVLGYKKTNMFKDSTRVPKDSSKYQIEEGKLLERDGYNIQVYNIKYIDEGTGYQQTRLYFVTVVPTKAPNDVLVICGTDVCGEFDQNPLNIASNCVEVIAE